MTGGKETNLNSFEYQHVPLAYYDYGGKGTPVLVLSGWGYGAQVGQVMAQPLLAAGLRPITVDLPGTGSLQAASSFVFIERLAAACAQMVRGELGLHEIVVFGHAFGAIVAQEMALSEDDVAAKLILMSPLAGHSPALEDLQASQEMLNKLLNGEGGFMSYFAEPLELAEMKAKLGEVFDQLDKPVPSKALSGQIWAASRWLMTGTGAQRIYQPSLIIHGRKDALIPLDNAQRAHKQIKNSQLEVLECGYLPFCDMPDEVGRLARHFLKK